MAEHLLALRVWITLDFKLHLDGYAWHALDSKRPIVSDPMKDIGAFRADAATVQALIAQTGSQVRPQWRIFRFLFVDKQTELTSHILANGTHFLPLSKSEGFIDKLRRYRVATFTVDPSHPVFARFARVCTTVFLIFLQGVQIRTETPTVNVRVALGQEMRDLFITPTMAVQETSSGILYFVSTESVFGFEYVAETRVFDGWRIDWGARN
jgi:hypothetical protein